MASQDKSASFRSNDDVDVNLIKDQSRPPLYGLEDHIVSTNPDAASGHIGEPAPPYDAAQPTEKQVLSLLTELIEKGVNINAVDQYGRTPLHDVIRYNFSERVIRLLLYEGANVNTVDNYGRTPLHDAALYGDKESEKIVMGLIYEGAKVNVRDNDGRTPLHDAVRFQSNRWVVAKLIAKGANVNAVDDYGRTPLHDAVRLRSKSDVAQLYRDIRRVFWTLINAGAEVDAVDDSGQTPLHYAGDPELEQMLLHATPSSLHEFSKLSGVTPWSGLDIYKKCEGVIGDNLVVMKEGTLDHCFVATTISDVLQKCYPEYASKFLCCIVEFCEKNLEFDRSNAVDSSFDSGMPSFTTRQSLSSSENISTIVSKPMSAYEAEADSTALAIIRGKLQSGMLSWTVSSNSSHLASEIERALLWTLSALRSPPSDHKELYTWSTTSTETKLPEITSFQPTNTEFYCWTSIFDSLCVVSPPYDYQVLSTTEGLRIDFEILLELTGVDKEIMTTDGTLLFGFDTALIPMDPLESKCWHFLVTDGRQITPERVKSEFSGNRFNGKVPSDYRKGDVFVALCGSPVVNIGTNHTDPIPIDDIKMPSGVGAVKSLEESVERSYSNDMSILGRVGILGSSIGGSGGHKREKKFKLATVVTKSSRHDDFELVLSAAEGAPCILWDQISCQAWLVPALTVLLFATLRYIRWKRFSFKVKARDGQLHAATITYAPHSVDSVDTTASARIMLRQNKELLVDRADGIIIQEEIAFAYIVKQMWFEMEDANDICISSTGNRHEIQDRLPGYDLNEAICGTNKSLRALPTNRLKSIASWLALIEKRTRVVFCRDAGPVLSCSSQTNSTHCCLWSRPKGSLSCLLKDLRLFYGGGWVRPPDVSVGMPYVNVFPIGESHEWVPYGYEIQEDNRIPGCTKSLQSITECQGSNGKLRKKKYQRQNRVKRIDGMLPFSAINTPMIVTFGWPEAEDSA